MASKKEAIEKFSDYSNTSRRYFLSVMGETIEKELNISDDWRSRDGWEQIVLNDFNGECIYCGDKDVIFEREHLDNIADGGLDIKGNIAPACVPCNRSKMKRLWKEYIIEKGNEKEHSEKVIQERIQRVENHRVKSSWNSVIKHPIYPNLKQMIDYIPDDLNSRLKNWALSWLFESYGGSEFLYHITPESEWLKAKSNNIFPANFEEKTVIPCSYESQLETYVTNKIWRGSRIVILSFKKSELEKQGVVFHKISSCFFRDDFYQIIGNVKLSTIHDFSRPFTFNYGTDIYDELKTMKNTITSQGKKLW